MRLRRLAPPGRRRQVLPTALAYVGANGDFDGTEGGSYEIACSAQTGAPSDRPGAGGWSGGRGAHPGSDRWAPAAADPTPLSAPQPRLADLPRADGTLDLEAGYRGNADARGYGLVSGSGAAPRFVPSPAEGRPTGPPNPGQRGFSHGAGGFSEPGTNDGVEALAMDREDHLYAGGKFMKPAGQRPTTSPNGTRRLHRGAPWGPG